MGKGGCLEGKRMMPCRSRFISTRQRYVSLPHSAHLTRSVTRLPVAGGRWRGAGETTLFFLNFFLSPLFVCPFTKTSYLLYRLSLLCDFPFLPSVLSSFFFLSSSLSFFSSFFHCFFLLLISFLFSVLPFSSPLPIASTASFPSLFYESMSMRLKESRKG